MWWEKHNRLHFNVMALDDTDQIPISLVSIAMVRKLRLVPSAVAVESGADLGTIANFGYFI